MTALDKIERLRVLLKKHKLDAYIITSNDPHLSEYVPEYWKSRAWISGFTGSAGTVVVSKENAALWTDSRYFIQAEQQLKGSGIELCKMGFPETPSIEEWLAINIGKYARIGFDGRLQGANTALSSIEKLKRYGIETVANIDLIDPIWESRPSLPANKAFIHELKFAGLSISEKIGLIRSELAKNEANATLLTALDEVCWAFNLRGSDVAFNPVVLAYGLITDNEVMLFIDPQKINEQVANTLTQERVKIKDYLKIEKELGKLGKHDTILVDLLKVNFHLYKYIGEKATVIEKMSPAALLKARKNSVELEGIRNAMVADGVALTKFFIWLEQNVNSESITELTIAEKLRELRSLNSAFISESFDTIAGYADHGAIVHYSATQDTSYTIKPEGFLLVDSGGQYYSGTTDITRTVHLSTPSAEEMMDYTLVLKGMIQLSMINFPVGTRGTQLDVLARMAMWNRGISYGHGTGHGVGCFLNVHEGPQSIRPNENPVVLEVGMVQSNEPGIYRAGKYGIRIENLIACEPATETAFGKFLRFETLTLCPIDTKPIDKELLTKEEITWLNSYHRLVFNKLSKHLSNDEKEWLEAKTKPV
ncbi:MAG: aminopeptidase P family protein [Bacteroidales bacterium]|nr:aminopeptidase P family protein [Bacteroidales bacterium]MBN2750247.1 aminopeptidase P family protein [Bacteroidales bacterium]